MRQATLEDLDPLTELFEQYRQFYGKISDFDAAKNFLKERIKNQQSTIFISIDENQKPTGFVQLFPIFSSTRLKKMWLLNDLFVHPDHRGQGISKQLIQKAQAFVRDNDGCGLILETSKQNQIGNSLYPKTHFGLDTENNYYVWNIEIDNKSQDQNTNQT